MAKYAFRDVGRTATESDPTARLFPHDSEETLHGLGKNISYSMYPEANQRYQNRTASELRISGYQPIGFSFLLDYVSLTNVYDYAIVKRRYIFT